MKALFSFIETIFVDYLFAPYDALRFTHNWWGANFINFIFLIVGFSAIIYWLRKLSIFEKNEKNQ